MITELKTKPLMIHNDYLSCPLYALTGTEIDILMTLFYFIKDRGVNEIIEKGSTIIDKVN